MESLQEALACLNAKFPRYRFRAVEFRSRRVPNFEKRPDYRAALVPGERDVVVYKLDGKSRRCKIENLFLELTRLLSRLDTFEKLKKDMGPAEAKVNKMGLEVVYRDTDYNIFGKNLVEVESEVCKKYPGGESVLQVFRAMNGSDYAYIALLGDHAFIQKPESPATAMRDLRQAMLVNSFVRGSKTCPICLKYMRNFHVAFNCTMHAYCADCVSKILTTSPSPVCPICRAPTRLDKDD